MLSEWGAEYEGRRARTTVRRRVCLEDLKKLGYGGLSKLAGEFEIQYRGGPGASGAIWTWMGCAVWEMTSESAKVYGGI